MDLRELRNDKCGAQKIGMERVTKRTDPNYPIRWPLDSISSVDMHHMK